ncbi:MAG: acylphosphatase [Cellulomonas sp.]
MTRECVARVRGDVQGVGFRWWSREQLERLGLTGSATNLRDGSVEVVARGDALALERFVASLRGPHSPGRVESVEVHCRDLP